MASELLLLNPRKRRATKRRRNPAHKKMTVSRASNPLAAMSPRKRRRNPAHKMANVRSRMMRRRNPALRPTLGNTGGQVMNAATGAVGALAVDAVMGQVNNFLPATLKTQYVYPIVKMGAALGLGLVASRVLPRHGATMAMGSMTVTMRDFLKSMLPAGVAMGYVNPGYIPRTGTMASQLNQSGVGMRGRMGEYVGMKSGMNEYVGANAEMNGLGMYAYR